jgi:NAD(P)-dependent dehydrogenase (short-subunit alcohol dehydrogenase family)
MGRVEGKTALITGAASGIGRATANVFADEGANVVVGDIDVENAAKVAEGIGDQAHAVRLNVTAEEDWEAATAAAVDRFGSFDILVNCAGILARGTVVDTDLATWNRVMDVNLTGTWRGCRQAVKHMKERGGAIVNISSVAAMVGDSFLAAYCASKGGVRLLTKSIALHCLEHGYDIRCNSVHPGVIETPMLQGLFDLQADPAAERELWKTFLPDGRFGEPEDVAKMVLYLGSDDARFVNGSEFVIDNGSIAA